MVEILKEIKKIIKDKLRIGEKLWLTEAGKKEGQRLLDEEK